MRAIHWVRLDKRRPAVLLTRDVALTYLNGVSIAPITSTIRGIAIEVPVGRAHGLDHDSVVNCDNVTTVPAEHVESFIGYLSLSDERLLLNALLAAFDLRPPPRNSGPPVPGLRG